MHNRLYALSVLGMILSTYVTKEEIEESIENRTPDWEYMISIANNDLLIPSLYESVYSKQLCEYLDPSLLDYLKEVYHRTLSYNKMLKIQLISVNRMLNTHNIMPTWFKGANFIIDSFELDVVSARCMLDLDFFVAQKDFSTTVKLLKSNGYTELVGQTMFSKYAHHWPKLFHKDEPSGVEVHRNILAYTSQKFGGEDIEKRAHEVFCNKYNVSYKQLNPTDQLWHCFLHSQITDNKYWKFFYDLRQLHTFMLLYNIHSTMLDRKHLAKTIEKYQLTNEWNHFLTQLKFLFNFPVEELYFNYAKSKIHFKIMNYFFVHKYSIPHLFILFCVGFMKILDKKFIIYRFGSKNWFDRTIHRKTYLFQQSVDFFNLWKYGVKQKLK